MAGAVLCGGASRRMGRDKALVTVDGVTMAARVASALSAAGCTPVVAIGGERPALAELGLHAVADRFPGEGPLGGVITALGHFPDASMVAVAACDLPHLSATTVAMLISALRESGAGVCAAVAVADRVQPLCGVWRQAALGALIERFDAGERRVLTVLDQVPVATVEVPPGDLVNVNTPDDLRQ